MRYSQEMAKILGDYLGVCFQIFIDDICVYSPTLEAHLDHLKLLFNILENYNLKLKWSKCEFAKTSVEFLGHVIDAEGIRPTKRNVQKLLDMPRPKDVAGVKSFLATANFYRRALKDAARVCLPLSRLLRKGVVFNWGQEQEEAFTALKQMLCTEPLMAYPDRSQIQILTTDGSSAGLGIILSQSPDGSSDEETVIGYGSRTLRGAETNYSASHVEAFAVVWGVNYFRHYLEGRKWILRTDHSSLKYIFENPKPSPKVMRWSAALMAHDYKIQWIKGDNMPSDSLSRLV